MNLERKKLIVPRNPREVYSVFGKLVMMTLLGLLACCGVSEKERLSATGRDLQRAMLREDGKDAHLYVNATNANWRVIMKDRTQNVRVIHYAASNNLHQLAEALVANGADLKTKAVTPNMREGGSTAVEIAISNDDLPLARFLAGHSGEDVNKLAAREQRERAIARKWEEERRAVAREKANRAFGEALSGFLDAIPSNSSADHSCSRCGGSGLASTYVGLGTIRCGRCGGSGRQ